MTPTVQITNPSTYNGLTTNFGVLNSKNLPNGVIAIYLQGKYVQVTDKNSKTSHTACCISFLNNLEHDNSTNLDNLIRDKKIGALFIQNGEIKSLTITKEQQNIISEAGAKQIIFKVKDKILYIEGNMVVRSYTSEDQYKKYVDSLI